MGTPRLFVLDTNVLMHDPAAIFRFDEHDVYLPMIVLEELDLGKKGLSESARNARQASRILDDLIQANEGESIENGLQLPGQFNRQDQSVKAGRLFFETSAGANVKLPSSLPGDLPDNSILATTLGLQKAHSGARVCLVSKDINLRIKSRIIGVAAEDYYNDRTLSDVDLLFNGVSPLPGNVWDTHVKKAEPETDDGRARFTITGPLASTWVPGQFVHVGGSEFNASVSTVTHNSATVELVEDYRSERSVWGINARNAEQNYVLNMLLNDNLDFVTVLGAAGTGKTLLALAAGLQQTLDDRRFKEIIMTRVTVPLGEDIGFLPGTEEEKMEPWMGALMDNLEVLTSNEEGGSWGRGATQDLVRSRIKIRSLNFMRGRTFVNRYIIVDEAQNLTAKQMKALVTRAGPGTKVVAVGNVAQIDTPYLTETTSGLTYVVNRLKSWAHSGHITLLQGERSRLADYAAERL
ncbi:MAG: PhoH family protein [Gammaproteobacteria bacterium]